MNQANIPIEVFWVDPTQSRKSDTALASMGPPFGKGEKLGLDSYSGHNFLVRLVPDVPGVEAKFKMGKEAEEFTVTYDAKRKTMSVQNSKSVSSIKNKIQSAKEANAKSRAAAAAASKSVTVGQMPRQINGSSNLADTINEATNFCQTLRGEEFTACMASNIIDDINQLTDTKTQLVKFRDAMSWRLRNYTCADDNMETSVPIYTYTTSLADMEDVHVKVLLNKTHSKVWTVDNFITDAECNVLQKHGKPLLRRATVAAEDGSSVVSENRKANQAAYNMNKQNPENDPLW